MHQTWDPDRSLREWSALGLWRHGLTLLIFVVVALLRWHHCLLGATPAIDEATYLEAFHAVGAGASPYEVGSYHYTPLFAWLGSRCVEALGDAGTLGVLRGASLAGLAFTLWCALAFFGTAWWKRLAMGVAYVLLAPAVGAGFCTGNLSFAVVGAILLALTIWHRGSFATGALPAGLVLGATVAAKPLAPIALVALGLHRPAPEPSRESGRRHQMAALLGALGTAALLVPSLGRLHEMAAQPVHPLSFARSFSLARILSLAGLEVSPLAIVVIVAILAAWLVRSRPLGRSGLLAVATTASVLATPIIWNHTLLLTLPLQLMALSLAFSRRRTAAGERLLNYEIVLVTLGVLAMQLSEGFGALDEFPRAVQAAFLLVPYLAPAALLAYVLRFDSARRNR